MNRDECAECGAFLWEAREPLCPHDYVPEYQRFRRLEAEEMAHIDRTWPRLSTRTFNAYWHYRRTVFVESKHFLPFSQFIGLSDRTLLSLRNFGKQSLKEVRHLRSNTFPEWDTWAAMLPTVWEDTRKAQECVMVHRGRSVP